MLCALNKTIFPINNVDTIYGGAVLTIVAASGDSASAGLPGVREESRSVDQHMEVIKGRPLITNACHAHEVCWSV